MFDFTKEVEELTIEAIDCLIEGIEAQPGLITKTFEKDGKVCALGAIGLRDLDRVSSMLMPSNVMERAQHLGLVKNLDTRCVIMEYPGFVVSAENDDYKGTPEGRKAHMLAWLRDQRAVKCSSWTPPAKEIVPEREVAYA